MRVGLEAGVRVGLEAGVRVGVGVGVGVRIRKMLRKKPSFLLI